MRVCALFVSLRLCVEKIFPMSHGGGRDGSRPYWFILVRIVKILNYSDKCLSIFEEFENEKLAAANSSKFRVQV